jgi:hypothetical protein
MYASMFPINMAGCVSSHDRGQAGRSLAAALSAVPGFVAFIAIEGVDASVTGLCVCLDASTLDEAHRVASAWQSERVGATESSPSDLLTAGEVIVQRGF